jgi:hypothetical protein
MRRIHPHQPEENLILGLRFLQICESASTSENFVLEIT